MAEAFSNICCETGRTFSTPQEARASEARFREIQAACDEGRVPELRKGDVIYVDTSLYLWHGCDDFRGGLAEVLESKPYFRDTTPYVCVVQEPGAWHNWQGLSREQKRLRERFGKAWSHPDPDWRPEFNEEGGWKDLK